MTTDWDPRMTRAERRAANKAAWAQAPVKSKRDTAERADAWRKRKAEHRELRASTKSDAPLPASFGDRSGTTHAP